MLPSPISEDYANPGQTPDWCDAATTPESIHRSVEAFLFQFCTSAIRWGEAGRDVFVRAKCLMLLTSQRLATVLRSRRQGCPALQRHVDTWCPGCAGIDSDVFTSLRGLPYVGPLTGFGSRKRNDSGGAFPTDPFAQREVSRGLRRRGSPNRGLSVERGGRRIERADFAGGRAICCISFKCRFGCMRNVHALGCQGRARNERH